MTVMQEKLQAAGFESTEDKIRALARQALGLAKGDRRLARQDLLHLLPDDPALMRTIIMRAPACLDPWLHAEWMVAAQNRSGQFAGATQKPLAAPGADQIRGETQSKSIRAIPYVVPDAMKRVVRATILDSFMVWDYHLKHQIPIGDLNVWGLTKRAAAAGRFAWASARERELYLMMAAAASKQAHIPHRANVRDVFAADEVRGMIELAGGHADHPNLSNFRLKFKECADANS